MSPETRKKWLRWVGIPLFVGTMFLFFLYFTFPYKKLFERLVAPSLHRANIHVTMNTLNPYFLTGVEATNVNIKKQVKKGTAEVDIPYIRIRLSILPLLFLRLHTTLLTEIAKGQLDTSIDLSKTFLKVNATIKDIQLESIGPPAQSIKERHENDPPRPFLSMMFSPINGKVNGTVLLDLPQQKNSTKQKPTRGQHGIKFDFAKAKGDINLNVKDLSIGPGYFPTSKLGEVPVPNIRLGNLKAKIEINEGKATIKTFTTKGEHGELDLQGHLELNSNLMLSVFQGNLRFKIDKSFNQSLNTPELGILKGGINMLGPGRNGFHLYDLRLPFVGQPRITRKY